MRIYLVVIFIVVWINSGRCQVFSPLPPGFDSEVRCLYYDSTTNLLYAGGNFTILADGTTMRGISVWDGTQWDSVGSGVLGDVWALAGYNGYIYAGGNFGFAGGVPTKGLARWNGVNWEAVGNMSGYPAVWKLKVINNLLYVIGYFNEIGGLTTSGIASFDGVNWSVPPILEPNCVYGAIDIYMNNLYVGGNFDGVPGIHDIGMFNGTNWVSVGGSLSGPATSVNDMEIYQNELYVVGNISTLTGDPGNGIIKWNGNAWSPVGSGLLPGTIFGLHKFNGDLYAGGQIYNAGGVPVTFVAKWNGNNWSGLGGVFDNVVNTFTSHGTDLYMGGGFRTINGDTMIRIAKYTIQTGIPEIFESKINIYPSVISDVLFIDSEEHLLHGVEIIDIYGNLNYFEKYESKQKTLWLQHLNSGVYIILVKTDAGLLRKKIVVCRE